MQNKASLRINLLWRLNCSIQVERYVAQGRSMRRLFYLLLLALAVSASATAVSASTDCERWFAAYRTELAHSHKLQRLAAARRRARRYAQRKLAGYVKPVAKPKPAVHLPHGPRMTPHDALRKVDLACGVLPEIIADQPLLSEETPGEFIPEIPAADEVGLLSGFDGPGVILPEDMPVPPAFSQAPPGMSGGGAPVYTPPFTTPAGEKTPLPPVVPEPSTFILMLTGLAGTAEAARRRLKA